MKLEKYKGNPILSPSPEREWESLVCTNPGAWYDEKNGEVILLYRAAGDDAEQNTQPDTSSFHTLIRTKAIESYRGFVLPLSFFL